MIGKILLTNWRVETQLKPVMLHIPLDLQVWERMNITVEPSAACAVAAVLSPKFKELAGPDVKRVGVVLCGGNVDLDNLPWTTPAT